MHMSKIPRHRPRPARPPRRRLRWWRWLAAASLVACLAAAYPPAAAAGGTAASASAAPGPLNCGPSGPCYSPQAYETAYGVAPLLRHGITGRGENVAIFALAQTPAFPGRGETGPIFALAQTPASPGSVTDIRKALAAFDTKFGLPRARLHAVTAI